MTLKDLYACIPKSNCKKNCVQCCSDLIQFTPSELNAMGGYSYNGKCSHLIDGKCSIYENRPFVCRIYGTSELFKCDDCSPDKLLSKTETLELVHQYAILKEKEEFGC